MPLIGPSMTQGAVSPSHATPPETSASAIAEGRFGDEALASGASAVGARMLGFGPGLVDEDKPPRRIDRRLTRLPSLTPPGDVRTVLL